MTTNPETYLTQSVVNIDGQPHVSSWATLSTGAEVNVRRSTTVDDGTVIDITDSNRKIVVTLSLSHDDAAHLSAALREHILTEGI